MALAAKSQRFCNQTTPDYSWVISFKGLHIRHIIADVRQHMAREKRLAEKQANDVNSVEKLRTTKDVKEEKARRFHWTSRNA